MTPTTTAPVLLRTLLFACLAIPVPLRLAAEPASSEVYKGLTPLQWSIRIAKSEEARLGNSLDLGGQGAKWDYANSVLAMGMITLGDATQTAEFRDFGEKIVGSFVADDGSIRHYDASQKSLDLVAPGRVLVELYQRTHEEKYRKAAALLRKQLAEQPRTSDGGFWHKQRYPYQMWLDSMYMGSLFYAEYAKAFGEDADYDDVAKQLILMDVHAYDTDAGLYYHGWDEAKKQDWADKTTGDSPSFWSRGMGWYGIALVDILDLIPKDHPKVPAIKAILRKLADAIQRYQDPKSGLWYQVTDQGARQGNYLEASASSMFVYTLAKGVNRGLLPRDRYETVAKRGYAGLIDRLVTVDAGGQVNLNQCCSGAGLGYGRDGTFNYYVHEPIVSNDPKGVGPFILAGIQMERLEAAP